MNLAIDIGNTRIKLALFKGEKIEEIIPLVKKELFSIVEELYSEYTIEHIVISSVANISASDIKRLELYAPVFQLNHNSKLPFTIKYQTPNTLGLDRIALVAAATKLYKGLDVLVIDAGTCITYDFVNSKNEYLGGAIAPGLQMRYKSLSHFTAKLPLLDVKKPNHFIGNSTDESIHSGVVNGMIQEIQGVINQYQEKYRHLTVILTGGDSNFLSKQLKSGIFANQNFLLIGLNEILILNRTL